MRLHDQRLVRWEETLTVDQPVTVTNKGDLAQLRRGSCRRDAGAPCLQFMIVLHPSTMSTSPVLSIEMTPHVEEHMMISVGLALLS